MTKSSRFEEAVEAYGRGQSKTAQQYAESFLAENPNHPGALALLGALAASENEHRQAVDYYKTALRLVTETAGLEIALAKSLSVLDDWQGVADALLRLPAQVREPVAVSKDYDGLGRISHKLLSLGYGEAANRLLAQLVALQPDRFEAWYLSGIASTLEEAWAKAANYFELAVSLNPSHLFSEWQLTRCYLKLGWLIKAKANLLRFTERPDPPVEAFELLAELALADRLVFDAIDWLEKATQRRTNDENLHLKLIELSISAGLTEKAQAYIDNASRLVANPAWILAMKCRVYESKGETDDALGLAKTLGRAFPDHPAPRLVQIKLLTDRGDFQQAKALISAADVSQQGNAQDKFLQAQARFYGVQYQFDVVEQLIDNDPDQSSATVLNLRLTNAINRGLVNKARQISKLLDNKANVRSHRYAGRDPLRSFLQFMVNELGSNGFALMRLESIVSQPLPLRIGQLCQAIDEEPGYVGFPITLLRSLRQTGTLEKHSPKGAEVIPRLITQFWDRKDIPEDVCSLMQSWIEENPSWHYQCFDDDTAQEFIASHFGSDLIKAYRACSAPALKADLFRLAYLYQCGGVYADCDDKCQTSIEQLFIPGYNLVVQQEIWSTVGNNFIGVTPRHPFLKNALELIASLILERQGDNIWFLSGPGMFTKAFCDTYLTQFANGNLPAGVRVLLPHKLAPFVAQHLPRQYKTDDRHWLTGKLASRSIFTDPLP